MTPLIQLFLSIISSINSLFGNSKEILKDIYVNLPFSLKGMINGLSLMDSQFWIGNHLSFGIHIIFCLFFRKGYNENPAKINVPVTK